MEANRLDDNEVDPMTRTTASFFNLTSTGEMYLATKGADIFGFENGPSGLLVGEPKNISGYLVQKLVFPLVRG